MLKAGSPTAMPVVNIVSLAVGSALVFLVGPSLQRQIRVRPQWLGGALALVMLLPFLADPIDGVRRWVGAGPIRLHASAVVAPLVLLSVSSLLTRRRLLAAFVLVASVQLVHVAQPDAGQATALALAVVVATVRTPLTLVSRAALAFVALAGALASWYRPDPLEPAPLVEGMLFEALELGPAFGVAAAVALVGLPGVALLRHRGNASASDVDAGVVLATYFASTIAVTFLGDFPTPVLGFGASPILGAAVGLGLLWGVDSAETHQPPSRLKSHA